ncbi:MAG TPA: hypothetical protein VFN35_16000 [Ktedonobacteraceae bacterium]|nr:hypothetical protein [Ktedonobacteraceae bacterium]
MQGAAASLLATWQTFYVIIGTAAATLTGLMFVVITLVARIQSRMSASAAGIATFSTPSVVHFCVALLIAVLLNAPWQDLWNTSLLLGLCGLAGIFYIAIVVRRARRMTTYQPVLEDWLWHTVFPLLSYTTFVFTAIMLLIHPISALFVTAAGTILLLFIGIHNAWDNVTYITLELFQQESRNPD